MHLRNIAALILRLAVTATLPIPAQAPAPSPVEIQMTAKKYEFSPSTVHVKQGDHVKLIITAEDRDHGFQIEGYQIKEKLPKEKPVTIEFTADKTGTFPFKCSVFCGMGHGKMKGELIVE
jgi:cytochrome c oxidase subunit 2